MSADPSPLRVLIVDDEAPARNRLRELLTDCAKVLAVEVVGEAANGVEALNLLSQRATDVVLLDIRMPQMDGIEFALHAQKLPQPPAIVFTTAYDSYAIRAFELNAVDYLLKPIRGERLNFALRKAHVLTPPGLLALQQQSGRTRTHLSVYERGKILLVPIGDVVYLKAELKYITVRTQERDYLLEESLARLEQEYVQHFVRIHRNCLVARAYITGFEKAESVAPGGEGQFNWVVLLKGVDEQLPLSRRQQSVMKEFRL